MLSSVSLLKLYFPFRKMKCLKFFRKGKVFRSTFWVWSLPLFKLWTSAEKAADLPIPSYRFKLTRIAMNIHDLIRVLRILPNRLKFIEALVQSPGLVPNKANDAQNIHFILTHNQECFFRIYRSCGQVILHKSINYILLVLDSVVKLVFSRFRTWSSI